MNKHVHYQSFTPIFTRERQQFFKVTIPQKRTLQNHPPTKTSRNRLLVGGFNPSGKSSPNIQIGVKIKPLWNHHPVIQHLDFIVIFPQIFGEQMVIYPCVESVKKSATKQTTETWELHHGYHRNTLDLPPPLRMLARHPLRMTWNMFTPQKFNIVPKNRQSQKETHLPTIIIQGQPVEFRGV